VFATAGFCFFLSCCSVKTKNQKKHCNPLWFPICNINSSLLFSLHLVQPRFSELLCDDSSSSCSSSSSSGAAAALPGAEPPAKFAKFKGTLPPP
jgi:hypothetical protein